MRDSLAYMCAYPETDKLNTLIKGHKYDLQNSVIVVIRGQGGKTKISF